MAFEKLLKRPPKDAFLHDLASFGRIPDEQFNDEVDYWRRVRALGGPLQIELGDKMLGDYLPVVDAARQSVKLSADVQAQMRRSIEYTLQAAIAGLSISQLLRRLSVPIAEVASYGKGRHGGLDVDLGEPPVARLYVAKQRLPEVLPPYDSEAPLPTWYGDGELAVRVAPAIATTRFQESHSRVTGEDFEPHRFLALTPRLLQAYVEGQ